MSNYGHPLRNFGHLLMNNEHPAAFLDQYEEVYSDFSSYGNFFLNTFLAMDSFSTFALKIITLKSKLNLISLQVVNTAELTSLTSGPDPRPINQD